MLATMSSISLLSSLRGHGGLPLLAALLSFLFVVVQISPSSAAGTAACEVVLNGITTQYFTYVDTRTFSPPLVITGVPRILYEVNTTFLSGNASLDSVAAVCSGTGELLMHSVDSLGRVITTAYVHVRSPGVFPSPTPFVLGGVSPNNAAIRTIQGTSLGRHLVVVHSLNASFTQLILPCAPGHFIDVPTQQCKACSPGMAMNSSCATQCMVCPPGSFSVEGASVCSLCGAGQYQNVSGQASCSVCAPSFFSARMGASECDLCMPGQVSALLPLSFPLNTSEFGPTLAGGTGCITTNFSAGNFPCINPITSSPAFGSFGSCGNGSMLVDGYNCSISCMSGYTALGQAYQCRSGHVSGTQICAPLACANPYYLAYPVGGSLGTCPNNGSATWPNGFNCTISCLPGQITAFVRSVVQGTRRDLIGVHSFVFL